MATCRLLAMRNMWRTPALSRLPVASGAQPAARSQFLGTTVVPSQGEHRRREIVEALEYKELGDELLKVSFAIRERAEELAEVTRKLFGVVKMYAFGAVGLHVLAWCFESDEADAK